jgi:signal transduction histidine kinase
MPATANDPETAGPRTGALTPGPRPAGATEERPAAVNGLTARDLVVLETETARLERSIQTFLDFARPPTPEKRSGDVCRVLEQTLELVRARADQQQVQIHCDLAGPLVIDADHEQLRQLFLNLLCNALDTLRQGGNIRITAACAAGVSPAQLAARVRSAGILPAPATAGATPAPQWITITIADNGPGVPTALGDRIFEPYVSTKDTGIGLGLAICRRIVEAHGGQITASNPADGGALFTVRLPDDRGKPLIPNP